MFSLDGIHRQSHEPVDILEEEKILPIDYNHGDGDNIRNRHGLRSLLERRRSSLTTKEYDFVQDVCERGHDDDIEQIHARLMDRSIFPEEEPPSEDKSDGESGDADSLRMVGSLTSIASSPSFFSEEREKILQERKSNCMIGKLWRAHESGIPVSSESSRRSLYSRGTSIRSLASSISSADTSIRSSGLQRSISSVGQSPGTSRETQFRGRRGDWARLSQSSIRSSKSSVSRIGLTGSNPGTDQKSLTPPIRHRETFSEIAGNLEEYASKPSLQKSTLTKSLLSSSSMASEEQTKASFRRSAPSRLKVTFADNAIDSELLIRDEKKEDDIDGSKKDPSLQPFVPIQRRHLLTREASVNNYSGAGIEVEDLSTEGATLAFRRPVLMRKASVNFYHGEGIEVADWEASTVLKEKEVSHQTECRMESLVNADCVYCDSTDEVRCMSFDETLSFERTSRSFSKPSMRRSRSDSDLADWCTNDTWLSQSHDDDHFDTWMVLESSLGLRTCPLEYHILGTSANDVAAQPHVLSPPLIDSLRHYLPFSKRGENFWLKYSLVRDGASMLTFLQHARGAKYSVLAIETLDGDVFGSLTTEPWRKNWNTFGGSESFLWKMRHSRKIKCSSIIDQAQKESEILVHPFTFENESVQICTTTRIAVGGGSLTPGSGDSLPTELASVKEHEWGFGRLFWHIPAIFMGTLFLLSHIVLLFGVTLLGISLSSDLMEGTSSPCVTFGSPSLSSAHSDGSIFQIVNVELWTVRLTTR